MLYLTVVQNLAFREVSSLIVTMTRHAMVPSLLLHDNQVTSATRLLSKGSALSLQSKRGRFQIYTSNIGLCKWGEGGGGWAGGGGYDIKPLQGRP